MALELLHTPYHLDYGSRNGELGSNVNLNDPNLETVFYLDYLHIVGKPLQPLTSPDAPSSARLSVSFQHWNRPFDTDIAGTHSLDLCGACFSIAVSPQDHFKWFIVMRSTEPSTAPLQKATRHTSLP